VGRRGQAPVPQADGCGTGRAGCAAAAAVQANVPPAQPLAEPDRTGAIREPLDASGRRTVIIIDGMSGKRQEVVIGSPEPAPDALPGQKPR
jgi:hypothetical protein